MNSILLEAPCHCGSRFCGVICRFTSNLRAVSKTAAPGSVAAWVGADRAVDALAIELQQQRGERIQPSHQCRRCGTCYFESQECDWCPGEQAAALEPADAIPEPPKVGAFI
jgi:hypothetical protein